MLLFFSNGGAGLAWIVESPLVGLVMVTFLSWMANAKMTFFTVQVPVWNMSGLMLRTVGLDNILTSVLCLRQEWYVVYQLVRKVHPFMLRGIWGIAVFWAFWFLLCVLCMLEVLGLVFYLLVCTRLGSCWCAFFWSRPLGVDRLGHYLLDHWEESMAVHNTTVIFGKWVMFFLGSFLWEPYMLALVRTAQSPWLLCMYGFLE